MTKEKILNNYKLEVSTGCHVWKNYLYPVGYGQVKFQGKDYLVHRLVYEFTHGPIPDGMYICHKCDRRACMNPDHLFIGTQKDNIQDMLSKGRESRGEERWNVKLTEGQVIEIRELLKEGNTQRKIAKEFGVSQMAVSHINTGLSWGWLR